MFIHIHTVRCLSANGFFYVFGWDGEDWMSVWFTSSIKMPLRNVRIKETTNTIHVLVLDLHLPLTVMLFWQMVIMWIILK